MQEEAKKHTDEVMATLAAIMRDETAPQTARIQAGKAILERGWGRIPKSEVPAVAGTR
jgi:uncharacterized protein (UPF0147 family)